MGHAEILFSHEGPLLNPQFLNSKWWLVDKEE
jgi:hypothetical protein